MKIFLIGYRCTGKTTLGKLLAKHLNVDFIDTDLLVEQTAVSSILEIVGTYGWKKFRQLEKEALFSLKNYTHLVIATGGGIILSSDNRKFIKKAGVCVWLDADIQTIMLRLKTDMKSRESRPPLTNKELLIETRQVLKKRKPLYEKTAHIKIDTSLQTPEEIVHIIHRRVL